ncbi:MAG TPA: hypothetical protein VHA75_00725 [Rugosimonospora sp.]|nr:hypothetical protein [Rugosimonospora sp.]
MKQPHEDIRGASRSDYLLSLDEQAVAHRDALIAMAKHLKSACLVGNPAPVVQRMYERITHPQPGDLVVEATTLYRADPDTRIKSLGILVEHREEWWTTDEQWEADKAEDGTLTEDDRLTDHAWYVQYGPDPEDICRWVNCDFIVLPIEQRTFDKPVGQRDGTSTTVDRRGIVGGLADAGFQLRS